MGASLTALTTIAFATTPATAQITPLPDAQLVEWECPGSGDQVTPGAGDPSPGALVTDSLGRVWFATQVGVTRVVRVTPPALANLLTQPATCNWWEVNVGQTGGLRLALTSNSAFVRNDLTLMRIDTALAPSNARTTWDDAVLGLSDLAVKGSNGTLRVYTTGFSSADGFDVLQELNPNVASGAGDNVRRWNVGTSFTGLEFLAGVAVYPSNNDLVFYSERNTDNVGVINVGSVVASTLAPGLPPNTIRRWNLGNVPPPNAAVPVFGPRQISVDSVGQVWIVTASGHIVRLDPTNNEATAFEMPFAPGKDPFALDADGTIGYTGAAEGIVGMLVPFPTPTAITFSDELMTPITAEVPRTDDTVDQFTATTPPQPKTATALQFDNPDGTFIEANVLTAGSPSPLGIARDVNVVGAYFYAIGGSMLRIGRAALPTEAAGLVTGGGSVPVTTTSSTGTFGLVAMRKETGAPVKGNLVYQNATSGRVKSLQITDLIFSANQATFSGPCSTGCTTFRVDITDNGAPWNTPRDTFKIFKDPMFDALGIPASPAEGGTLSGGNVVIHHK